MDNTIVQRINRIYAAIGAAEEDDPNKLKAAVIQTSKVKVVFQDFRGDLSNEDLSNYAHTVIHNIAHMENHLMEWAKDDESKKAKLKQTVNNSRDLQIIIDLSNRDKHGRRPRDGGRSRQRPQLVNINRVMQLQNIGMTLGTGGVPAFFGDGGAKAIITGDVVDNDNNRIGDLHEIVTKAIEAWEQLLADFGLIPLRKGT